jgi:hypothetical protein
MILILCLILLALALIGAILWACNVMVDTINHAND